MTQIRCRALAALLACVVFAAACGDPGNGAEPLAGVVLPSVQVTAIDGASASIDAYRGRVLVLNVWATWCGPCRKELPSLDRLSTRLDANRFVVAGLAVDDDRIAVREYLLQNAIRFPNLVAVDRREIQAALAARTLPQTLIIAADGSLLERIEGARDWDSAVAVARIEAALLRGGRPATGDRTAPATGPSPADGRLRSLAGSEGPSARQHLRTAG